MTVAVADAGNVEIRRSGIGGSDAAAVAGVSRWRSPMAVYLEKIGQSAPSIETERFRWGKLLEDAVAREYAHRRPGRKVRQAAATIDPITKLRARVVRHSADKPWRMANVDRLTSDPADAAAGIRRGLEIKTADAFAADEFGEEGSDEVPPDYLLQCQQYLGVTGYDVWDLAVLIGGTRLRIYTIHRDDELLENLWAIEDEFWLDRVVARNPPAIDGSDASRRFLEGRHQDTGAEIAMNDRLYDEVLRYGTVQRELKDAEARKDEIGNRIRELMGDGSKARRDNTKVSWSNVTQRRVDVEGLRDAHPELVKEFTNESTTRQLRVTVKEDK